MHYSFSLATACLLVFALAPPLAAAKKKRDPNEMPQVIVDKKKKKPQKEITQTLPTLKEPPHAVVTEAGRLTWLTSPLSGKGLLSQQTRDALRWLMTNARGATIVKLRAFAAGTGDVRRIQELVSEIFAEKRLELPALSVVQIGALPMEGAQVQIEATLADRRMVNENGIAFISAQRATYEDAAGPLTTALQASSLDGTDMRHITCFVSSYERLDRARNDLQKAFPSAATTFIQLLRGHVETFIACEGVAALKRSPAEAAMYVGKETDGFAVSAFSGPGRILLSGTQLGFHSEDADLQLAFDRLGKTLEANGTSYHKLLTINIYALGRTVAQKVEALRRKYQGTSTHPAGSALIYEGLPGTDASFAMDVVAAI